MTGNQEKWRTHQTALFTIGGHAQRMLPYLRSIYPTASYAIAIDAPKELARIGRARMLSQLRLFSLGRGETAATLCEGLPQDIVDHISLQGGMAAADGMGQSILVSRQAGTRLLESPGFQLSAKQEFIPEIRRRASGALEDVRCAYKGSLAGGTYAGSAIPIADGMSRIIRGLTTATVRSEFLATGAITYEGLGDRVWKNGAAALVDLVAYVISSKRDKRDIRSLRLIELPICGSDESQRDAFLAQIEQSSHCQWMEYDQARTNPNNAQNGRYGTIQTWEVAFGQQLEFVDDIVPAIADCYVPPLKAVLDRKPSPAVADGLELEHARTPLATRPVEEILETALDFPAEDSLAELHRPNFRHAVEVWARIQGSKRLRLLDAPNLWAQAAATVEEIDERMQLQRRLLQLLADESEQQAASLARLAQQQALTEREYFRAHSLLTRRGVVGRMINAVTSNSSKLERLTLAAHQLRSIACQQEELSAEQVAVDRMRAIIATEHRYLKTRLSRLIERLKPREQELGDQLPAVIPFPLNVRLKELWDVADESDVEFSIAVRGSVRYATLAGLAKITGACAPRAEEIAQRIAAGEAYIYPAPPWGGFFRADQGKEIHMLPPVEPDTMRSIVAAVAQINPSLTVVCADAAPAVVNVVAITMRLVRKLDDVLTAPYQQALIEVLQSPCIEMFLPEGLASLQALGIEFDGHRLLFPKPS